MRKIRLIWDFYGGDAEKTAEHHVVHLKEFMAIKQFNYFDEGTLDQGEFHCLAYITVEEKDVIALRDILKPNRAFVIKPKEE